ncbi:MAG: hypothetical protein NTW76_17065 [Corynebacteriales bacterium]|uniref:Tetratricopeptide repeat protein n=1 Tax=Williamsia herbipolensis TaxID=1603258 RepID=A0AAU4K342_9NOCA|nr:hypothetical protein [Williamsia herbipolensis]MCX6471000.1 hypothetical protein [Mycobacteriales bacterium]
MGERSKRDFYSRDSRPIVLVIVVILILLAFYIGLLGVRGVQLIQDGSVVGIGLGIGVLILPFLGVWMAFTTVRAGIAHQRLGRRMREEGRELDVSDLPRRPSGRLERDAADELFATVKTEWEADPENWRNTYRIARAYDFAGDRSRAREMMKRAVAQEKAEHGGPQA